MGVLTTGEVAFLAGLLGIAVILGLPVIFRALRLHRTQQAEKRAAGALQLGGQELQKADSRAIWRAPAVEDERAR